MLSFNNFSTRTIIVIQKQHGNRQADNTRSRNTDVSAAATFGRFDCTEPTLVRHGEAGDGRAH